MQSCIRTGANKFGAKAVNKIYWLEATDSQIWREKYNKTSVIENVFIFASKWKNTEIINYYMQIKVYLYAFESVFSKNIIIGES